MRGEDAPCPAPSGAARLLATGTLRPAPPPEPGCPPSPARPCRSPGGLCAPQPGWVWSYGPTRPWGLSAPSGGPSADPGSPVPTDPPSP